MPAKRNAAARPAGFPIVGIGASAGGLAAAGRLLRALPADVGAAFVLIAHRERSRRGLAAAHLDRRTALRVVEVQRDTRLAANHVYVIPPNTLPSLRGRTLLIGPAPARRGLRLPVDCFLRSLAQNLGSAAAGILLSGTGSDGALGLREIRAAGGMTIAQDPSTARYDGLPRTAIAVRAVDQVLAIEEMASALSDWARQPHGRGGEAAIARRALEPIVALLRARARLDLTSYRRDALVRQLRWRMSLRRVDGLPDYLRLLEEDAEEVAALRRDLCSRPTRFWRDAGLWHHLEERVVPALLRSIPPGARIRAWVPGCATGEEAYSVAMLLWERLSAAGGGREPLVFASDVDEGSLAVGRAGLYPESIAADVSPARLRRFFTREDGGYRVKDALRGAMAFAQHDLLSDPPFTGLHLISCRHVLPRLQPAVRHRLLRRMHLALDTGGHLVLGGDETGVPHTLFAPASRKWPVYRRIGVRSGDSLPPAAGSRPPFAGGAPGAQPAGTVGGARPAPRVERPLLDVATLVLGPDLTIRSFTPAATRLFRVTPADVGRSLVDIPWSFTDARLVPDAERVLRSAIPRSSEIRTRDGASFVRRILPRRAEDERNEGVVVRFSSLAPAAVEAARLYAEGIVDTVREALIILDGRLRVRWANRTFYEQFRTTAERIEGRPLFEIDKRRWNVPALRAALHALRRRQSDFHDLQVTIAAPGGGRRSMLVNGRRFAGVVGRPVELLLAIEDATERLENAQAASASEAAVRTIVETAVDAIVTIDARGAILSFNPAAERMFGYPAAEVLGRNVGLLLPEPDRSRHDGYLRRFARTGERHVIGIGREVTGLRRDGTRFPIELALAEQVLAGSERRFTGILRDITERRRRERHVATQAAVSRVLASSLPLAEATPHVLRAICEGLGWQLGEMWHLDRDSDRLRWDGLWHDPSFPGHKLGRIARPTRALADGLPGRVWATGKPVVVPDLAQDGELEREARRLGLRSAFAFPLLGRGEVLGVMVFFCTQRQPPDGGVLTLLEILGQQLGDVVARKLAEDETERHRDELSRVRPAAALGELASTLAHELNQPLSAVANDVESCAAYLRSGRAHPTRLRQLLARAGAQAMRAGEVVHHIRRLVQRRPPLLETFDLRALARTVIDLMSRDSALRGIRIVLDGSARSAVRVRVDRVQIEQVLFNLLLNALDATEAAAPRRREVVVAVTARPGEAHVCVRDHGPGLTKSVSERLFEPFFTTKPAGMGMGLALSRSIVEAHNGRIWVAPTRGGGGATVCFTLPLLRAGRRRMEDDHGIRP